jgi:hypothetical protein
MQDPIDDIVKAIRSGKKDAEILKAYPSIRTPERLKEVKAYEYMMRSGKYTKDEAREILDVPDLFDTAPGLMGFDPSIEIPHETEKKPEINSKEFDVPKQKVPGNASESTGIKPGQSTVTDFEQTKAAGPVKTVDQVWKEKTEGAKSRLQQKIINSDPIIRDIIFDNKRKAEQNKFDNFIRSDNTNVSNQEAEARIRDIYRKNPKQFVNDEEVEEYKKAMTEGGDDKKLRMVLARHAQSLDDNGKKELKKDLYTLEADGRFQEDVKGGRAALALKNLDELENGNFDYKIHNGALEHSEGFLQSFAHGLKQRFKDLADYDFYNNKSDDEVISKLEENRSKFNPDVAQPTPSGIGGEFGGMLGAEGIAMAKGLLGGAAGSIVGGPTGGAIGATALTAPEYYERGYASGLNQAYNELRNKGYTPEKALETARKQAKSEGVFGAVEGAASVTLGMRMGTKIPTKALNGSKFLFTKSAGNLAKGLLKEAGAIIKETAPEAITDAAIAGASQVGKNISAQNNNLKRDIDSGVLENIEGELLFSGMMAGVTASGKALVDPKTYRLFLHNISLNDDAVIETKLQEMEAAGQIDTEEAEEVKADIGKYRTIVKQIPENVDEDLKPEIVPVIVEREEVAKQAETANKAFQPVIKEKLDELDNKIQKMSGFVPRAEVEDKGESKPKEPEAMKAPKEEAPKQEPESKPAPDPVQQEIEARRKKYNKLDNDPLQQKHNALLQDIIKWNKLPGGNLGEDNPEGIRLKNDINVRAQELGLKFDDRSGKLKHKSGKNVQMRTGGNLAIDDNFKSIEQRDPKAQEMFAILKQAASETEVDLKTILPNSIIGADGKAMSNNQLNDALDDLQKGIPSKGAQQFLDAFEEMSEHGIVELRDGQRVVGVPLAEYLQFLTPANAAAEHEIDTWQPANNQILAGWSEDINAELLDDSFNNNNLDFENDTTTEIDGDSPPGSDLGGEDSSTSTEEAGRGDQETVQQVSEPSSNEPDSEQAGLNQLGQSETAQQDGEPSSNEPDSEQAGLKKLADLLGVGIPLPDVQQMPATMDPDQQITLSELGIKPGDTIGEVLDKMIAYGGEFTPILEFIKNLPETKKVKLEIYEQGNNPLIDAYILLKELPKFEGLYFSDKDFRNHPTLGELAGTVVINDPVNAYYTFVHEMLHHVTIDSIMAGKLNSAVGEKKLRELRAIYQFIKQSKEIEGSPLAAKNYGLATFEEFMVELFINPAFRNNVGDIFAENAEHINEVTGGMMKSDFIQNLINILSEFIRKLFGRVENKIDYSKPMIDNAVQLATDIFFNGEQVVIRDYDSAAGQSETAIREAIPNAYAMAKAVLSAKEVGQVKRMARAAVDKGVPDETVVAAIQQSFPDISTDIAKNILENAKVMNIHRALPIADPSLSISIPPHMIPAAPPDNKRSWTGSVTKGVADFFRRFFSSTNGLPQWIRPIKNAASGEVQAELRRVRQTLDEYNKLVKKLKFKDAELFDNALRDPGTYLNQLPSELQPVAVKMRAHVDRMSRELIIGGHVTPEQAFTIENNIGEYMHRAYKLYNQKGWAKNIDPNVKEEARRFLVQQAFDRIMTQDPTLPIHDAIKKAAKKAENDLKAILDGVEDVTGIKRNMEKGKDTGVLKQRKDVPEPIRNLLGEYTQPAVTYAMTIAKMASLKSTSNFLIDVRKAGMGTLFFEEHDENKPAEFSVPVATEGSETWSPLNGLYTTPEIKKALRFDDDTHNSTIKGWLKFVGAIRWGKTVGSPVTQLKNFESNLGFSIMNGYHRVGAFADAWGYLVNANKTDAVVDKLTRLGVINQAVNLSEIKAMFRDDTLGRMIRNIGDQKGNWYDPLVKIYEYANRAYGASDNFWKVYAFLNEAASISNLRFKKPYSKLSADELKQVDAEAAERTKNTQPTYDRVWAGAKALSKNIPIFGNFLLFQAESFRVLFNTIGYIGKDLKDPAMRPAALRRFAGVVSYMTIRTTILNYIAQVTGVGMAGVMSMWNDEEEDTKLHDMNRYCPDFMRSGDKLVVHEGDGVYTVYDVSSVEPYNGFFRVLNAFTHGGQSDPNPGVVSALRDLVKPYTELEMNFEVLSELYNNNDDRGNKIYKGDEDMIGNKGVDIMKYAFGQLAPSVIGFTQRAIEREDKTNEIAALFGGRGYKVDVKRGFSGKLYKTTQKLAEIKSDFYIDGKEDSETAAKEANERTTKALTALHEAYVAALRLGVPAETMEEMIEKRMSNRNYSRKIGEKYREAIKTGVVTGDYYESESQER